jgi:hypothetical protein
LFHGYTPEWQLGSKSASTEAPANEWISQSEELQ